MIIPAEDREKELKRWTPIFETLGLPLDRYDYAVDYAVHYQHMHQDLMPEAPNYLAFALRLFKELDLDGVRVLVTPGPVLDLAKEGDNVLRVAVGTQQVSNEMLPGESATEHRLYLKALEGLNNELEAYKSGGKPFVFIVYALPSHALQVVDEIAIFLRYAIINT